VGSPRCFSRMRKPALDLGTETAVDSGGSLEKRSIKPIKSLCGQPSGSCAGAPNRKCCRIPLSGNQEGSLSTNLPRLPYLILAVTTPCNLAPGAAKGVSRGYLPASRNRNNALGFRLAQSARAAFRPGPEPVGPGSRPDVWCAGSMSPFPGLARRGAPNSTLRTADSGACRLRPKAPLVASGQPLDVAGCSPGSQVSPATSLFVRGAHRSKQAATFPQVGAGAAEMAPFVRLFLYERKPTLSSARFADSSDLGWCHRLGNRGGSQVVLREYFLLQQLCETLDLLCRSRAAAPESPDICTGRAGSNKRLFEQEVQR
jgi:hypothetical protein